MDSNKKTGPLGNIYKSVLSAPFKLANLPFKSHRQYYGKPKEGEVYEASFIQKQRLKKILPLLLNGKNLSEYDRHFMDMFNDFLTGEGQQPVNQSTSTMNCDDKFECVAYLYRGQIKKFTTKKSEKQEKQGQEPKNVSSYSISFNEELKPKNSAKTLKKGNTYMLKFLGKNLTSEGYELIFSWKHLEEDDYLIFKTKNKNPIGVFLDFKVYQDNSKRPYNSPLYLGVIPAKIS
jgi:hypothetical protein